MGTKKDNQKMTTSVIAMALVTNISVKKLDNANQRKRRRRYPLFDVNKVGLSDFVKMLGKIETAAKAKVVKL
eukprot:10128929-Ditylum_brightwellii.AAC.1